MRGRTSGRRCARDHNPPPRIDLLLHAPERPPTCAPPPFARAGISTISGWVLACLTAMHPLPPRIPCVRGAPDPLQRRRPPRPLGSNRTSWRAPPGLRPPRIPLRVKTWRFSPFSHPAFGASPTPPHRSPRHLRSPSGRHIGRCLIVAPVDRSVRAQGLGFGVLTTRKRATSSLSLRMLCRCPAVLGTRVSRATVTVSPSISISGVPSST